MIAEVGDGIRKSLMRWRDGGGRMGAVDAPKDGCDDAGERYGSG